MDQTGLHVTAPNDPDPRWPEGYVAVLREAGAKEKNISYCLGWVRRFFARFPGRLRSGLGRSEIETFLSETAAHPAVSNWQVQQARDSLDLYYERFRGIALEPRQCVPGIRTHSKTAEVRAGGASGAETQTRPDPVAAAHGDVRPPGTDAGERERTPNAERPTLNAEVGEKQGTPNAERPTPSAEVGNGTCNWAVLEERLKDVLRTEHYAYTTEQSYVAWVKRYVAFEGRKPSTLAADHVQAFLRHLAVELQVASSTQNQAA